MNIENKKIKVAIWDTAGQGMILNPLPKLFGLFSNFYFTIKSDFELLVICNKNFSIISFPKFEENNWSSRLDTTVILSVHLLFST